MKKRIVKYVKNDKLTYFKGKKNKFEEKSKSKYLTEE